MLTTTWLQQQCAGVVNAQASQVWIAYSGGVDSHVLLHLAQKTFSNVRAIHINDQLSDHANTWQQHCVQVCMQLNVPLDCVTAKVDCNSNIENAARVARRQAWQNMLGEKDVLLLAHHADDQAETILYRLLRGTGPHGLVGMRALTKLGAAQIWRPLLNISKQQITDYAMQHQLKWISDEANADTKFDRNFLRQKIMPMLQQRWPAVANNLNRTGHLTAQLISAASPALEQKLQSIKIGAQLDLNLWQNLPLLWRVETLRAWLKEHAVVLSYKQLQTIMREVIAARDDAQPEFKCLGRVIRRAQHKLFVLPNAPKDIENFVHEWDFKSAVTLPNGKSLTPQDLPPQFAHKFAAQLLTVKLGAHGRKAKKIFQQYSIPPWERNNYPLVFAGMRLVSIVGLWNSSRA